jgi:hypothetical protein
MVAFATAAQGVETLNSDSIDDPLTRTRSMELLCEASEVVNECLEGQDGVQRWISAVARDGAGITMRKNLKIVCEMILSIQQVARDYFILVRTHWTDHVVTCTAVVKLVF